MTSDPTSETVQFHYICCGLSQNTWIQIWISEFGVKCHLYHTCTLGHKTLCDNISHGLIATFYPNPKNHGSKIEQVLSCQNVLVLIYCKYVISHFLTVKEAEKRNWISPGNRGGGRNERKKNKNKDYCPSLSAANPSSTPHKNIWRLSVAQPSTSSYTPTLRVRQTHTIWKHTFSGPPRSGHSACRTAWNLPLIGGVGCSCVPPPLSCSYFSFSSFLIHSPWLRPALGPHKAFVRIDGLWVALEQGYTECSRSLWCRISDISLSLNHIALTVNEMPFNEGNNTEINQ